MPNNCTVLEHPLLSHFLTQLRNKHTPFEHFRTLLTVVSRFLAYESTRHLKTTLKTVETPLETTQAAVLAEDVVVVNIMRAGGGMLEGFLQTLPHARVGHIGIYRDKFLHNTVEYYLRMPEQIIGQKIFLLDPLLATGYTAVAAISRLKELQVGSIYFACLLAAPEGLELLAQHHPDVQVITLSIEQGLNPDGYILPGLGDAGGRLYGT